jgi:hypothetical protein
MVIKRVNALSAAKVMGLLGLGIGLVLGAFMSLAALVLGGAAFASDEPGGALVGMIFGVGAIVMLPLFYGGVMFVGGLIQALLYNVAARFTGGVEVEVG